MAAAISPTLQRFSAEDLWRMPEDLRCELVAGEITVMSPAGPAHGRISGRIAFHLYAHTQRSGDRAIYTNDTGFLIARNPDTVLAPDIAVVDPARLAEPRSGYFDGAPDLAIEVVSPDSRQSELDAKVRQWLDHGARAVWVVYPTTRSVVCHAKDREALLLHEGQPITGGDVLPGFTCDVARFFE